MDMPKTRPITRSFLLPEPLGKMNFVFY